MISSNLLLIRFNATPIVSSCHCHLNHSRCHFHCVMRLRLKTIILMTHTLSGSMCQEPATPWNGTYFINEFHEFTDSLQFVWLIVDCCCYLFFIRFLVSAHAQILRLSCCCYSILITLNNYNYSSFFMHKLIQTMWIKSNPFGWMYDVRHSATTIYYYSMESDIKCDTLSIGIYEIMAVTM